MTLARKRCSFSTPENLCYADTGKRGADFDVKNPCLPVMTGRENRDTLLTDNDRFLGMKEDYLMDQEILKIAIEYISSEIKQGDFVIFRRFL